LGVTQVQYVQKKSTLKYGMNDSKKNETE